MPRFNPRSLWVVVIPFLLLSCWLGARDLDKHPFWGDEINTIRDARGFDTDPRSLPQIWNSVAKSNPDHAPGYFMLLNLWGQLTSWQPETLRFFSLLIGLLAIAVTYRIGRQWLSAEAGLAATIILSVSATYIFYFTQTRVYTLTVLLPILALFAYLQLAHRPTPPSRRLWLFFFLSVSATLYSHYLASIPLIGIGVYHLLFAPKNRRWWMIVAVGVAGALTFAPWVWVLVRSINRTAGNEILEETALSAPEALASFVWMFSNGVVVLLLGLLAFAAASLRGTSQRVHQARQVTIIALAALAALLILNQIIGLIAPGRLRYLLPLWPLFALVAGLGVAALRRWRGLMPAVLTLWVIGGLWSTLAVDFTGELDGASFNFPINQIAHAISHYAPTNDLIVNYPPDDIATYSVKDGTFVYYYQLLAHLPISYTLADHRTNPSSQASLENRLLKTFQEKKRRIWLVYTRDSLPAGLPRVRILLAESNFQLCPMDFSAGAPAAGIELYVPAGVSCPLDTPSNQ